MLVYGSAFRTKNASVFGLSTKRPSANLYIITHILFGGSPTTKLLLLLNTNYTSHRNSCTERTRLITEKKKAMHIIIYNIVTVSSRVSHQDVTKASQNNKSN